MEQADVAALMSAILRLPYPVNSVGSLPIEYLSGNEKDKVELMRVNALQIAGQFAVKMETIKKHSSKAFFRPFNKLSPSDISKRDIRIKSLIQEGRYKDAAHDCKELIQLSSKGLTYYHTYNRMFLYFAVLFSFVGWIVVTAILGVKQISVIEFQTKKIQPLVTVKIYNFELLFCISVCVLLVIGSLLYFLETPWTYYIYFLLPIPIWHWICVERFTLKATFVAVSNDLYLMRRLLKYVLCGLLGVWILIGTFFYRRFLSPGLLALSVIPHLASNKDTMSVTDLTWMLLCWCMAAFPNLPTVGRNPSIGLVILGGCLASAVCLAIAMKFRILRVTNFAQFFLPIFSSFIVSYTFHHSSNTSSVPNVIHIISWVMLFSSWLFPVLSSTQFFERLVNIYVWQLSAYILLCLSYDALFCALLCALMHTWIHSEHEIVVTEDKGKYKNMAELDFQQANITLGKLLDPFYLSRDMHKSIGLVLC